MKWMTAGRLGTAGVMMAALLAVAAHGTVLQPPWKWKHAQLPSGASPLMAFGGRSAVQMRSVAGIKLDAALADLSRHVSRVRPGHEIEDLHSLSPAARFLQGSDQIPRVAVDAVTRGDPQQLKEALVGLGLQHPSVYANDVGGWLPVSSITAAAARAEVVTLRAAMSRTRAAPIATQGDFTQGSAALRTQYPALSGAGVTVGILSDSFNCYEQYAQSGSGVPASGTDGYAPNGFASDDAAFDESNGYLTSSVNVLEEATCLQYGQPLELPFTDEGRAMLQIVHVVAPDAALAFYTASNSEADFANGIAALAAAGATVIADDTGYFDEPFFQDGILAQAVDAVAAKGVAYFSAAGNDGRLSYENTAPSFGTVATSGPNSGEYLLNFNPSGSPQATSLPVTIPALFPGEFIAVVVEWDQPYVTGAAASGGATSRIDLCVAGASKYTVINLDGNPVTCTGANSTGSDPVQVLILGNPANATSNTGSQQIDLQIGLAGDSPAPGRIKLAVEDDGAGSTIDEFDTNSPTLQGHPGAAGAAAVAAAFFAQTPGCGTTPALLEAYSSAGGEPILFDTAGNRLTSPEIRQKPDITGPDGVNTSFFGFFLAGSGFTDSSTVSGCQNDASYLNYFGTSAATPHAAGIAALALQAIPSLTPAQIVGAMHATAAPMGAATPNFDSGYGFIQAAKLAAPVIWLPGGTVSVGNTTTLSWLDLEATSCSASGSWSGAQPVSGTQQVTATAVGSSTYTLSCTGTAGTQSSSVTLQAVAGLSVTTNSLAGGQVGTAYSATLGATGGVTPYTWSLVGSALPTGLSLNAGSGQISGTPTSAVSSAALTFQVTDSEVPATSKTATLSLTIAAAASSSGSGSSGSSSGSGGGGGAVNEATILALSAIALMRLRRAQPGNGRASRVRHGLSS